jgi:hypothetical protein
VGVGTPEPYRSGATWASRPSSGRAGHGPAPTAAGHRELAGAVTGILAEFVREHGEAIVRLDPGLTPLADLAADFPPAGGKR